MITIHDIVEDIYMYFIVAFGLYKEVGYSLLWLS